MRFDSLALENMSRLIKDYRKEDESVMTFFDYSPFDHGRRVEDLRERQFNRKQLVSVLHMMNENWGASSKTHQEIDRLIDDESVVVIGGQQAGIGTGPLYTINKIISLIQYARQKEEALNIPVIPVFWVAGEDHDYEEINHIYLIEDDIKKHTLFHHIGEKRSISNIEIDRKDMDEWISKLFKQLPETAHSKKLHDMIEHCLKESHTYVDFFSKLIHHLFANEGLVLVDSNHPKLRTIESNYFREMIYKQEDIAKSVNETLNILQQKGYSISLDAALTDAHLFIQVENERVLLERDQDGNWVGKQNEIKLTTEELLQIAESNPSLLSNNVVTRPLMQELLFPTLAFIGGNGEISYWAALKGAFHSIGIKMPPVLPRLSMTYIDAKTEKLLNKYHIGVSEAINNGVKERKINWLAAQHDPPVSLVAEHIKQSIADLHEPLQQMAERLGTDMRDMAEKNLFYINKHIDKLERRLLMKVKDKYKKNIDEFQRIEHTLHPLGVLQERVWNPLLLINKYGMDWMNQIVDLELSIKEEHFIIYL